MYTLTSVGVICVVDVVEVVEEGVVDGCGPERMRASLHDLQRVARDFSKVVCEWKVYK